MADRPDDRERFGRHYDEEAERRGRNYERGGYYGRPGREGYSGEFAGRGGYGRDAGYGREGYRGPSGESEGRGYGRYGRESDYGGDDREVPGRAYGPGYDLGLMRPLMSWTSRLGSSADYSRGDDRDDYGGADDRSAGRRWYGPEGRGGEGRGFFERAGDEVRAWFGDEEAERRRHLDERRYGSPGREGPSGESAWGGFGRGPSMYGERGRDYGEGWGAAGPYTGRGPKGYRRSDERIREDVNDRLMQHGEIDASEIEVSVSEGVVTLAGTIDDRRAKHLAEDVADSVSGVKDVINQLRVTQGRQWPQGT